MVPPRQRNGSNPPMVQAATLSAIERVFAELDWSALGEIYCEEGGDAFWAEHRRPALELGCAWADALSRRLPRGGASLYVGAGVAELPAVLCELLELDRRVVATNRRGSECQVLTAGLRAAGIDAPGLSLHPDDARQHSAPDSFDHLSLVSVLTDPESWPVAAAVTYGRVPPVLLDIEAFARERDEIASLVDELAGSLERPSVITTTVDEVPWLMAWSERAGATLDADDEVIDTAIVGDPIGFLIVS